VHFGIVDLRGERYAIADTQFDADEDLREARELAAALRTMTHREWFFSGVDATIDAIVDPKMRQMARDYYRAEREVYGIHGAAVLDKLRAFLTEREPERLAAWPAETALEAGCGTGQYPIGFARRFKHVYVTDLSYVSLVQARRIAIDEGFDNVTVFASNIERLPLRARSIDFVHCNSVLEHAADPERIVAETARVLSDRGVALYLSPNRHTLYVEPHFNIVAFSFWPMPLRRWLVRRFRGKTTFSGTRLRSLGELSRWGGRHFAKHHVFFVPRRLERTAMGGPIRTLVRRLLALPLVGLAVDLIVNRALLAVMPYHVLVGFGSPRTERR
jgi:SAM-dependent methyltransferase